MSLPGERSSLAELTLLQVESALLELRLDETLLCRGDSAGVGLVDLDKSSVETEEQKKCALNF